MASPIHPNEFAIRQKVLYYSEELKCWREGLVTAVSIDKSKNRETHGDACDENQYVIADQEEPSLPFEEQTVITACMCEVMITDADATGRWSGQRLGGARGLALVLVDVMRRKNRVDLASAVSETDDPAHPDLVQILEVPGYHHLASARVDDLVAWASGIPAADWKEPYSE